MNPAYIFVSGAAGGIGSSTVNLLAQKGFWVFAGDVDDSVFELFSNEKIIPIRVDITDDKSIEAAVTEVKKTTEQLYGLVNIAGIFDQFALVEAQQGAFRRLIEANLVGAQQLTQALFPLLKKVHGRVINLSSETVLAPLPLQSYGLSKQLFDSWNTQLRLELALLNMRAVVIRAGGHQTPFIQQSLQVINQAEKNSSYSGLLQQTKSKAQRILSKKQGDPRELALVIYKALSVPNPSRIYHVNISLLFRILSILPSVLREYLVIRQLKKMM